MHNFHPTYWLILGFIGSVTALAASYFVQRAVRRTAARTPIQRHNPEG